MGQAAQANGAWEEGLGASGRWQSTGRKALVCGTHLAAEGHSLHSHRCSAGKSGAWARGLRVQESTGHG